MKSKRIAIIGILLSFIIIACNILTGCAAITGVYHNWRNNIKQTVDRTKYETRKEVEDTCRATIVSYESDKLTWEQYKDSDSEEKRGTADSAKIRANKAALVYNEYFLKNSYVFDGNIPSDIRTELELIK